MDMEESAEESNAAGEQYEEEIVPKIITDEVYDEHMQRANIIIRDLQMSKQYVIAEDIQKLVLVCQNLRQNVYDEKDKIEQMKGEVNNAQARVQQALKASKQDQEVIQQLKSEIGTHKYLSLQNFYVFPISCKSFFSISLSDQAWKNADASALREQIAQEAMNVLREKLEKLQKEAEKYTDRGDANEE
jgi:uncharacterized protein YlxW (UPF0749 family)